MDETKPSQEATAARRHAEGRLRDAEGQWNTVRGITASLRNGRQENHFVEKLGVIFREKA